MIFEYKNWHADVTFSAVAKCYYGELALGEYLLTFQASNKQDILNSIQQAVDQFLVVQQFCC